MAAAAHSFTMRATTTRPVSGFANKNAPTKAQAVRNTGRKALSVRAQWSSSRPSESEEQTRARRNTESQRVSEKTFSVKSMQQLEAFLVDAGDKLVMLNVEREDECDVGNNPDAYLVSGKDASLTTHASMAACDQLKSDMARVARDANDVVFLTLELEEGDEAATAMAKELGVDRFPTQQYYKNGELAWQHIGAGSDAMNSIGESVLYYGGQGGEGQRVSQFIDEIKNSTNLADWIESCSMPTEIANVACEKQLAVLDVSLLKDSPQCMHIFPAVLALAKNTAGATRWARLLGDESADADALMKSLNVSQVPTFIFYLDGKEVDRLVGNDRMAIVGKVVDMQRQTGVVVNKQRRRPTMTTAEARKIASQEREEQARLKAKNLFM